ncbi:peptidoglycan editing factor PgeF [soil metagenome]
MFAFRDRLGRVEFAFTDRYGGVSEGPWSSLNLGTSNGDEPARVVHNFAALAHGLGVDVHRVARMSQVQGCHVEFLDDVPDGIPVADALVTRTPTLTLLVRAADCAPVVLADPDAGVVAVAHAGRQGMLLGIVPATIATLRDRGATRIRGWLGPRICGGCYEVPEALRNEVTAAVPEAWAVTSAGTPGLDIAAGIRAQLRAESVDIVDVADSMSACTYENADLFSYRRQGQQSGRFGATVRIAA